MCRTCIRESTGVSGLHATCCLTIFLTGCKVRDAVRYDRFTSCSVALDCSLHRLQKGLEDSSALSRSDLLQRCFVLHRAAARTRVEQEVIE